MKPLPVTLFALAAASPLALLVLACLSGGVWVWVALAYMTVATVAMDSLVPWVVGEATASKSGKAKSGQTEFPATDRLLVALGLGALIVLPLLVWVIASPSAMGIGPRLALFLAGGLWFGQVAHPAAHELIHRPGHLLHGIGVAVYSALLFGHHASAHRLVHHRHVATKDDPNSAPAGEGFYRFLRRAWPASIRAGLAAERALRAGKGGNPYLIYAGGAVGGLTLGWLLAGVPGLLVWLGFGLHFGAQVLLSDYVQHYGLTRGHIAGRIGPVTQAHSWNAPHWFSSALMLNAPRHSDHHVHPQRPYPSLRLAEDAPLLPWPLPVACLVALYPPLWRRRMKPLLARHAIAKL
ncbi:MAG: alkane 1-monooxygenase [Cypionkella sp.]